MRLALVLACVVVCTVSTTASAQVQQCRLVGYAAPGGHELQCTNTPCSSEDDCAGEEFAASCAVGLGVCRPRCGSLIPCERELDCPTGTCIRVTGGELDGRGFCEFSEVYCESGAAVDTAQFIACFTLPFSDSIAPSWLDGDCDRDGCPNAHDFDVCADDGAACDFGPTPMGCDTRQEGIAGPEACVIDASGELLCSTPHFCDSAEDCPGDPGVEFTCDGNTCRPAECGTLYACRTSDDCPRDFGGGMRTTPCRPIGDRFPGPMPADGFCDFPSWNLTAACLPLIDACARRPDGSPTMDFFAGDCDGDRCPNGIDDMPCVSGWGSCVAGNSLACGTPLVPPPETDGGTELDGGEEHDGGGIDGGMGSFDGGVRVDGATSVIEFGGGGGCRCTAGARRPGSVVGIAMAIVAAHAARRRRR